MKIEDLKQLVRDEVLISSYKILTENVNPEDHYDFEHTRKNLWEFIDRTKIKHFLIIHQSLYKGNTKAEIKFGWIDSNGKENYNKPPSYDSRIFNTYIYIFINEILKYYKEYFTEFYLEANDELRYRLYRQTLSKFLNKDQYELIEQPENNIIIIKPIS